MLGASSRYGLALRIVAAFGAAETLSTQELLAKLLDMNAAQGEALWSLLAARGESRVCSIETGEALA